MPLFTDAETTEWEARQIKAEETRPDDEFPFPNKSINESRRRRRGAYVRAYQMERLRRVAARPEDVVNFLLVAFHEKGTVPITWDEAFGGFGSRLAPANTPETRRHVHTILQGLSKVPRSWAKSATTRFFRGTGKQGKPPWSERPGAGVMSKDYGWKTYEATWYVELFYGWPLNDLFFSDDSIDCYSEEGHEIDEEGGNRFAATRKERDDEFFALLLGVLDARGLGELPEAVVKKAKPRKVKTWEVGDKVTSRNLRDLPHGAHLRWLVVKYPPGHHNSKETWEAEHWPYELVFLARETGNITVRPVMKGKAFGKREMSSSVLCRAGSWTQHEVETTYLGQWEGEVIDVEIARDGWTSGQMKKVKMKTVRVEYDQNGYVRTDYVRV